MKKTYRAMQVTTPGTLELVERETPTPGTGEVLIAVEACGICGADANDIEGADPALRPPRVPGHEVVGRIVAVGDGVPSTWKPGRRVGVGRLGGHCSECAQCRQGLFQLCRSQPFVGASCDGGYAEMMVARGTGLVSIPDELESEEAAPILCAGLATFNALKRSGAEAGDLVAVLGIGGLGHMALQYARRMGFRVAAVGRGRDIARDALELGAHVYIDTDQEDAAERLKGMGGAKAIITTIGNPAAVSSLMGGLAPQGRLVLLGAGKDPLPVSAGFLVRGERGVMGSITGSPYENEKALDFSVLTGVRPLIETMPLEKAFDAYRRMKSGDVKFRMVLTMGRPAAMRINDDLSQPVIVHAAKLDWVPSPAAGVDRRMLFRIGGEVARATSIVRYAPGSAFPRHTHGGGEEIVVLEGVFQDEHGDYPAGCYFRNPPGTSHVPASKDGCTIFVRLWQFRDGDAEQIVRQPSAERTTVLFDDGQEAVRLQRWDAGATVDLDNPRGLEFLVLAGGLTIGDESLEPQSWGRLPAGTGLKGVAGPEGARLWLRDAPLLHPDVLTMP